MNWRCVWPALKLNRSRCHRSDGSRRNMIETKPVFLLPATSWCRCCGRTVTLGACFRDWKGDKTYRCSKHIDRNPCAIEGCTRTTKALGQYASDQWFCSEHWRIACPPKSKLRQIYNRFFRKAKRFGWSDQKRRAFFRFWNALVNRARKRCEGDIDMAEINKMFGWD